MDNQFTNEAPEYTIKLSKWFMQPCNYCKMVWVEETSGEKGLAITCCSGT